MERSFGTDLSNQQVNIRNNAQRSNTHHKPVIVSVEAAIGSGKSSLLKMIQMREPTWVVVQEPVDRWQNVGGQHNLLEHYYSDFERYAFSFQTYCVLTRIEAVQKAVTDAQTSGAPVIVLERSWHSDRHTFAAMQHEQGKISDLEWTLYNDFFKFLSKNSPTIDGYVYLSCTPETCMHRLHLRNRSEEAAVTSSYQTALIQKTEGWLRTLEESRVCRVGVDEDFLHNAANGQRVMDQIRNFAEALRH